MRSARWCGGRWGDRNALRWESSMPHILIVDDEPNVASALALLLRGNGYQTTIAHNGRTAQTLLGSETTYDLVLLDLDLGDPLVNGLLLCREIRSRAAYLPVIILTVYGATDDKVLGLDYGADDYITK